jgi:hypothetical protein
MNGGITLIVKNAAREGVYRDNARLPEVHREDPGGQTIPEGSVCKLSTSGRYVFILLRGKGDEKVAGIWLDERTWN